MFFPGGFLMKQVSCCVLFRWFSHETGFMLCSFEVFFFTKQDSCLFFPSVFFYEKEFMVCYFPEVFT